MTKDQFSLPLKLPEKAHKKKYKDSGLLRFFQCHLDMAYSLLDYVRGGCALRFMAAIDFSVSIVQLILFNYFVEQTQPTDICNKNKAFNIHSKHQQY